MITNRTKQRRKVTRLDLLAAFARTESLVADRPKVLARVRAKHRETLAALDNTAAELGIAGEWGGRRMAGGGR